MNHCAIDDDEDESDKDPFGGSDDEDVLYDEKADVCDSSEEEEIPAKKSKKH